MFHFVGSNLSSFSELGFFCACFVFPDQFFSSLVCFCLGWPSVTCIILTIPCVFCCFAFPLWLLTSPSLLSLVSCCLINVSIVLFLPCQFVCSARPVYPAFVKKKSCCQLLFIADLPVFAIFWTFSVNAWMFTWTVIHGAPPAIYLLCIVVWTRKRIFF